MNTQYRLQVLHSGEVFETSEKALSYIDKNLAKEVLVGEPAVAFYGDEDDPDVILCVGSAEQKVYTIDITAMKAQIAALEEGSGAEASTLVDAVATIEGILTAAGLTKTELKEGVEVTPDIDVKDPVIGDATSLAEAIALLSEYAQSISEGSQFEVADTNSIQLTKEDGVVKAYAKISTEIGNASKDDVDDNIVGVFSDGLYAVAHLDYDEQTSTITFTTSGVDENGDFKRDANVETVTLGGHTEYTADNEGNTVKVEVDNDNKTISANAQISSHENNILVEEDGKLLVKGTADNIAYAEGSVADELSALETAVSKAAKATEYDNTDTISFAVTQDANDETRVSADVLLSNNNSINVSDGGLNVNLKISVNQAENTLTVKLGDAEETYDLPGVEIIDNIEFKDGNLVIHYGNGKEVTVPLEGLVAHYVFDTDEHSDNSIHFDSEMDTDGVYHISANVKLRTSDNLIEHTSEGELYVSKEAVEGIVSDLTASIVERVTALETSLSELSTTVNNIDKSLAVDEEKMSTLETNLDHATEEIATNTASISTLTTQVSTLESDLATETEKREATDTSLQEQIDKLTEQETGGLEEAKEYTDEKVAEVQTSLDALDEVVHDIHIDKVDNNDLQYELLVDGRNAGYVDIPVDLFLKDVYYDSEHKAIVFDFLIKNDAGEVEEKTVLIYVSDMVSDYTSGDGILIDGGRISIHVNDAANEKDSSGNAYLTLTEDGLALLGINEALATKAEATDVTAIDERVKAIESDYATSSDIKTVQDGVDANASAIEKLEENFDDYKFHTADTSTVELVIQEKSDGQTPRELSAKAIISSGANNNIVDNEGLYAVSDFNYNSATNVITFTNTDGVHEFTINTAGSLVVGGYYDSTNHAVVLIVSDGAGETHEISIPIADLIYDIDVHNDVNDPVELEITTDSATGAKVISATLRISSDSDNLIDVNNGALFASNEAKDMYCINSDGTQETIQEAVSGFYKSIDTINDSLQTIESEIAGSASDVSALKEQVDTNTSNITALQTRVTTVENNVTTLQSDVAVLKSDVSNLQEELSSLKDCLGDICSGEGTVADRLKEIEEAIAQLVDFDTY